MAEQNLTLGENTCQSEYILLKCVCSCMYSKLCIHQLTVLTAAVFPLRVAGTAAGGGGRRRRRPAGRCALRLIQ